MKLKSAILAAVAAATMALSSQATTIDFGTSWPAYVSPGTGNYSSSPYNRVLGTEDGQHATVTQLRVAINSIAGTSFVDADVVKEPNPAAEQGGSNGWLAIPSGWTYAAIQYDGPNGGIVVIKIDGNDAKVPYDSSLLWGDGDKYAVTHWAVVGRSTQVPDGGASLALLGAGVAGLGLMRRRK